MMHLAIIPSRSGSKGLRDKNIRVLAGKPMLAYSIEAASQSGVFETIMVSTDSFEYASIAKQYGAEVPFLRSTATSTDSAGSWDVVMEVLQKYREIGKQFHTVCLLQPTSPLRRAEDIINGYRLFREKEADAVTAVCEANHHAACYMKLPKDLSLCDFRRNADTHKRRQDVEKLYVINGALYIRRIQYEENSIMICDESEYAYVMEKKYSVDIDDEYDFRFASSLMESLNQNK